MSLCVIQCLQNAFFNIWLRKVKALRKHSLHGKIAASVLLKLFISGIERCHTTDAHIETLMCRVVEGVAVQWSMKPTGRVFTTTPTSL